MLYLLLEQRNKTQKKKKITADRSEVKTFGFGGGGVLLLLLFGRRGILFKVLTEVWKQKQKSTVVKQNILFCLQLIAFPELIGYNRF